VVRLNKTATNRECLHVENCQEKKKLFLHFFSCSLSTPFLLVTCMWFPSFCKQMLSHMGKCSAFERKLIIWNNCVCAEPVCSQAGMARSPLLLMVSTWTLREAKTPARAEISKFRRNMKIVKRAFLRLRRQARPPSLSPPHPFSSSHIAGHSSGHGDS